MRRFISLIHRYVGLIMAIFLLIAGLTGAILAWYHELDAVLNPRLMQIQAPSSDVQPLNPFVLQERVKVHYPDAWVNYISLNHHPGKSALFFLEGAIDPVTGESIDLPNDEVFLNPYTGEILGERKWAAITQGWHNLLPFIYTLHHSLALGDLGMLFMGVIAVLWTVDCFIGACLTFPASQRNQSLLNNVLSFGKRWWKAWKIRWSASPYKLNFDLHRAGGLWLWVMLFVFAWSSVAFNLNEVYHPVMQRMFSMQPDQEETIPQLPVMQVDPGLSWPAALEIARSQMASLAEKKGFSIRYENSLGYNPYTGVFRYQVLSDRDVGETFAGTNIFFDANTGRLVGFFLPTGEANGDTITTWLMVLHTAAIWGISFKIFITFVGLFVTVLSATGIYIWWKKRHARLINEQRRAAAITNATST